MTRYALIDRTIADRYMLAEHLAARMNSSLESDEGVPVADMVHWCHPSAEMVAESREVEPCPPFNRALAHTLAAEGYYTDSGPTYRGIDRRHWPEWSGWAVVDDWMAGTITVPVRDAALVEPVE